MSYYRGGPEGVGWLPFERARSHARRVANTQLRCFLVLLVKVFFGECGQLGAVFLFDGSALAVELLNVFEPEDSVADPGVCALESVLVGEVSMRRLRCRRRREVMCGIATRAWRGIRIDEGVAYLELGAKGRHSLDFGHSAR